MERRKVVERIHRMKRGSSVKKKMYHVNVSCANRRHESRFTTLVSLVNGYVFEQHNHNVQHVFE